MVRFFSESNPVKILLIFILGALIRIPYFADPIIPEITPDAGFFYQLLVRIIPGIFDTGNRLSSIFVYLLLFLQGLSLNGFINSQKLFGSTHLLFVFVYVLFTSLMSEWNVITPFILVNTIMVFVLPKVIELYQKNYVQNELFIISVLMSICSLLFTPAALLVIFFYISLLIIRPFRFSEWVIVLIGLLLPYYLLAIYAYVWDEWGLMSQILPNINFQRFTTGRDPADLISFSLLLIPLLVGGWYVHSFKKRTLALQRKIWTIVLYYLLISAGICLGVRNIHYDTLLIVLLPASFYITGFLYYPAGKFIPSVYSWLIIGFLLVRNFL